jgi:ADP-heptose:LPS heptosyltransferase
MAAAEFQAARRVLFVRLGKLGDLMAGLWLLERARKARPDLRLDLLALPRVAPLLGPAAPVDQVLWWRPLSAPLTLARIRARHYDLLVDINDAASSTSALIARLSAAHHTLAFRNAKSLPAFDATVAVPSSQESHVLERLGCMATALGLAWRPSDLRPVCPLPAETVAAESAALRRAAGPRGCVVALNLSAGHASRYWAAEKWNALAGALLKASPRVRLLWLHLPADAALKERASAGLPAGRQLQLPPAGFGGFCARIKASQMLVSPDTSAVHVASAFRVPVLGLYPEPAWNFKSWAPCGTRHRALRSPQGGVDAIPLEPACRAALQLLKPLLKGR